MTNTAQSDTSQVILITGAASGLGWALTQRYSAMGHIVVMMDVQAQLLQEKADQLIAGGLNANKLHVVVADITNTDAINHLVNDIQSKFGCLDVLINNAGITHRSLVEKTKAEVIRKVMAVDYQGPVELAVAALPLLKESKGTIINVSSMAGWMPVLGRAGYCAAKSALHQFFEVMRCEIKQYDVKILMVYPSFLDTPIEVNALGHDGKQATHARSMVGGLGSADTVADSIIAAHKKGKQRLFPNKFTWVASVLYKLLPSVFLNGMTKKFASELDA